MNPKSLAVYTKEYDEKQQRDADMLDYAAWLNGLYVMKAIGVYMDKRNKYPESRFGISEEETVEDSSVASMRFSDWAEAANRAWKKRAVRISEQ